MINLLPSRSFPILCSTFSLNWTSATLHSTNDLVLFSSSGATYDHPLPMTITSYYRRRPQLDAAPIEVSSSIFSLFLFVIYSQKFLFFAVTSDEINYKNKKKIVFLKFSSIVVVSDNNYLSPLHHVVDFRPPQVSFTVNFEINCKICVFVFIMWNLAYVCIFGICICIWYMHVGIIYV